MKRRGKKVTASLLTAAMVLTTITGCQGSGTSAAPVREAKESFDASEGKGAGDSFGVLEQETGDGTGNGGSAAEDEDWMKNQKYEKGRSLEAEEPEKADISPEDYERWNQLLEEKEISREFAEGLKQFAYKSGSAVLKDTKGNGNYSPLSLYYTLALAGCGAKGETAGQILKNLGVKDRKELADQCGRLYQWYVYQGQREREQMEYYGMDDYQSAIRLGNSLWISHQLAVGEEYQRLAAEKFFASSYGVDFADSETGKRMGAWIAEKTNGVLEPQLTLDPGTVMAILNTLYFYGGWANPFSPEMTQEDIFTPEEGDPVTVPFLNRTETEGVFRRGENYTLSYLGTDNNCRMVFLLPDEGTKVGEFLESQEKLQEALETEEDWVNGKVIWKVPKFDFGSSYQLNETLKAMGMERMFEGQAEFGGISPDPLMVSSVIQETHIGVDEQGVEGAAYTMMAMARGALIENEETAEMILDRPFLFGIRDDSHDVWLFLGVCRNPAEKDRETAGEKTAVVPQKAEYDVLLTSAPEICLTDTLSSTTNSFSVMAGNYGWNWEEKGEMVGVAACGSHPLEHKPDPEDMLKIPNYNRQEEVVYMLNCVVMPRKVTVREWDISQVGQAETAEPEERVYQDEQMIFLKKDKVYELVAEWPREELEKKGFFGEASYVVVTD